MAHLYKLTVTLQSGKRLLGFGFFINGGEAFDQTMADYPEATSVAAIQLTGRAA